MDLYLFLKIIGWIGLVVSGLLTALSVYNWYHYNFTKAGEFEQQLMRLKGQRIDGYYFTKRAAIFVLCLAALISMN